MSNSEYVGARITRLLPVVQELEEKGYTRTEMVKRGIRDCCRDAGIDFLPEVSVCSQ